MTKKQSPPKAEAPVLVDAAVEETPRGDSLLPGALPYSKELQGRMNVALAGKGTAYVPRTHHKRSDGSPKFTNRLIFENSPYLLQHAHNPVDWRPWGDEAFAEAERLGRPVLLSVGYATCHWCHVMERESFEDEEIAQFINENFISIKVDRERRPDVDNVYMTSVRLLTGGGGWPMTVVMTPKREPFFGGTYFPPRDGARGSRKGFLTILKELAAEYRDDKDAVVQRAGTLSRRIQRSVAPARPTGVPGAASIVGMVRGRARAFDWKDGGFGGRPKFPRPVNLETFLRYYRRTGDPEALWMVTHTLDKMADGGLHDQVGGGFHRYSVDSRWLIPHFEKMLYDNAQLVGVYLEAWQITGDPYYREIVERTCDYVLREMRDPGGAFWSATDADSPAPGGHYEEGLSFTWTPAEIDAALPPNEAAAIKAWHGVTKRGNFEGRNHFHNPRSAAAVAAQLGVSKDELQVRIKAGHKALYAVRAKREPPLTDDKVLAGWNGLMISALSRAGLAFGEQSYIDGASVAADFVLDKLYHDGKLTRVSLGGSTSHDGVLDDYAFLAYGLLDLFEATASVKYLSAAIALHETLESDFWDPKEGGYWMAGATVKDLLVREKPDYDGARPSGNSIAIGNLLRLYEITQKARYRTMAERALGAFGVVMSRGGGSVPKMLSALDYYLDEPKQIVIVKPDRQADNRPLLRALGRSYVPNRVLLTVVVGAHQDGVAALSPLVAGKVAMDGKVTAYVCKRQVCLKPTSDPEEFATQIAEVGPWEGIALEPLPPAIAPKKGLVDAERSRRWDHAGSRWVRRD
jgi:uncharacterized protein YyaL (SSP411 family)